MGEKFRGFVTECVGQAKELAVWLSQGLKLSPQWVFVISAILILGSILIIQLIRARRGK